LIQLATQSAFYNRYKKYPSTYETAPLRKFYNGRTETARTMNEENQAVIDIMNFEKPDTMTEMEFNIEKKRILMLAHKRYLEYKDECSNFEGFDRYLLALDNLPNEKCPLTKHYTYKKGGANNFHLSTSSVGSFKPGDHIRSGGVAPYREDGYGVFNNFGETEIILSIYWYKTGEGKDNFVDGKIFGSDIECELNKFVTLLKDVPIVESRVSLASKIFEYPVKIIRHVSAVLASLYLNYFG